MKDWLNFLTEIFSDGTSGAEGCLIEKDRQVFIWKDNAWETYTLEAPAPCENLVRILLENRGTKVSSPTDFEGSLSLHLPEGVLLFNVFRNKSHQVIWCTPLFSRSFPGWKTLHLQPEISHVTRQSTGGILLVGSSDWVSGSVAVHLLLKELEANASGPVWMVQKWPECAWSEERLPACQLDVDSDQQILRALDSALIANSAVLYLNDVSHEDVLQKAVQVASSGATVVLRVQAHSADSVLRSLWCLNQKWYERLVSLLHGVFCVQHEKGSLLTGNLVLSSEYLYVDSALREHLHSNEHTGGLDSFFRASSGHGSHRMKESQERLTKEGILDQNQRA